MTQSTKRGYRIALASIAAALCACSLAALAAYLSAPHLLSQKIIPEMTARHGIKSACEINCISPWKTAITKIAIGTPREKFATIESLTIKYAPAALAKEHKIKELSANGILLRLVFQNGRINLAGLDAHPKNKENAPPRYNKENEFRPTVENCEIRNSKIEIFFLENGRLIDMPIEVCIKNKGKELYEFSGSLDILSCKINFSGETDIGARKVRLSFGSSQIRLENLQDILRENFNDLSISGKAGLKGDYDSESENIHLSTSLQDFSLQYKNFKIQNDNKQNGRSSPIEIEATVMNKNRISVRFNKIIISQPFQARLNAENHKITAEKNADGYSLSSSAVLEAFIPDKSKGIPRTLPIALALSGSFRNDGNWQFSLNQSIKDGENLGRILKIGDWSVRLEKLESYTQARGSKNNCDISFSIGSSLEASNNKNIEASLPDSKLFGKLTITNSKPKLSAFAKFANASANLNGLKIKKLDTLIPFKWPAPPPSTPSPENLGFISAKKIYFKNFKLGSIYAQLAQQNALLYAFTGEYLTPFKNTTLDFEGIAGHTASGAKASFNASLAKKDENKEIKLQAISKSLPPLELEGKFNLSAKAKYESGKLDSSLDVSANETLAKYANDKISIEGMQFALQIPELTKFSSPPAQILKFSKIKAGKFETEEGIVEFQIESSQKYFIDRATVSYCDGHIYTHSLRLSPGKDIELLLYCDRLNLASIINQFSEKKASGNGSVNGRIPLLISKKKIEIKDGFLYSTPGKGGKISLDTQKIIPPGVPLDSPALANLAIANEALRNFDYDWIRISLDSKDDDLACVIEADGRPAGLLPFGFDSDRGYFFKDNQGPGANFKGIEFKFNLLLPFNKIYGN